ncbi:MAG: thiolase family protein [Burkholderiaceae bacterium]|jgi:acetyl-CoA acetyltransferase|nr:thiolase family protein [Burkholderiaceae bacterium]
MKRTLKEMRPVYVAGIGWHRYQDPSDTSYVTLGLAAARQALGDARLPFAAVDTAFVARALLGMACGRPILRHLGATGLPITHVENASASGSTAFRSACIEVASGAADTALVLGVDKRMPVARAETQAGIEQLAAEYIAPFTHFALLADKYAHRSGADMRDIALVAVKNHNNGALNPNAQRQKLRTLDEVVGGRKVSGELTVLQCTPVGEGAAAVVVMSEDAIKAHGVNPGRAVRVLSSSAKSQALYEDATSFDELLTQATCRQALQEAGVAAADLDVVELHDAFSIEEVLYVEAMGLCQPGQAIQALKAGEFHIGGRVAVSPSGGLIAMGHPIGPTGVGQIAEITLQLRGEAGQRQQPRARTGMAHMVGVGAVCYAHVLGI